jgi:hypothetical protein
MHRVLNFASLMHLSVDMLLAFSQESKAEYLEDLLAYAKSSQPLKYHTVYMDSL